MIAVPLPLLKPLIRLNDFRNQRVAHHILVGQAHHPNAVYPI